MNYRSINALNRLVLEWIPRLPRDLDLIVGVPRSGMLVANLLALHANLPFTDIEGLLSGRLSHHGRRSKSPRMDEKRQVLIVDDSLNTGGQLRKLRDRVAAAALAHEIRYAVAYVRPGTESLVDFHGEVLDNPRVFEWNLLHHSILLGSCLDIDGALCADPTSEINDDGPRYCDFLQNALPLIIPSVPVGWLVTSRLEKYRALTEQWLAKHGVEYRELIMMDAQDKAARVAQSHGAFKAAVYRSTGADLFIESDALQAIEIASLTGSPVFCMDTREMILPEKSAASSEPGAVTLRRSGSYVATADSWTGRLQAAMQDLLSVVPRGESVIVMDEWQWGLGPVFANRRIVPFIERDGQYWGPPEDAEVAKSELERMRARGVNYAIVGWPAFWWLEHFPEFDKHLRSRYRCEVENDRVIAFDLRT